MSVKKIRPMIFGVLMIASLVLASCAPAAPAVDDQVGQLQSQIDALQSELKAAQEAGPEVVQDPEMEAQLEALQTQLQAIQNRTVVEFWTTDNEEERVQRYEEIAQRYMDLHPEVEIRIVPIEEAGLSQRISTAVAANRLPDIVRLGIERVAAFAADGILDEDAAAATITALGEDDFRSGPLQMVTNPATGKYSAVPFDGWIQAIWYREDVFSDLGLAAPIKWDDITTCLHHTPRK